MLYLVCGMQRTGVKFDVSNADDDDNMRCTCGSDEKAEFVEEAKGCLILLTPCAVQRGGARYTADKSNAFELEVEWRKGPHWATLADERMIAACVPDDCGGIGARIVTQRRLDKKRLPCDIRGQTLQSQSLLAAGKTPLYLAQKGFTELLRRRHG